MSTEKSKNILFLNTCLKTTQKNKDIMYYVFIRHDLSTIIILRIVTDFINTIDDALFLSPYICVGSLYSIITPYKYFSTLLTILDSCIFINFNF